MNENKSLILGIAVLMFLGCILVADVFTVETSIPNDTKVDVRNCFESSPSQPSAEWEKVKNWSGEKEKPEAEWEKVDVRNYFEYRIVDISSAQEQNREFVEDMFESNILRDSLGGLDGRG